MLIVKRVGWYAVKTGMWSPLVVEGDIVSDRLFSLSHCAVGFEVDLVILDGSPEALHEHIVSPAPFAVHADTDAVLLTADKQSLAYRQ